ncbi:UvrD-helicase domain-containing protein (plasmid) [Pseudomonas amygdali pv. lachrymans]|uniref:UvrD-helicase domain-containing protein n=1 Tax=Pseudomonas amygdali TaxID=47877 RepID=UPI0006CD66AD|nr:UvrD-helicase domain-containing protein [Pseudomonas amygdali]KPC02136.1 UvrD/Rep family helicase [Pseudomonas amygdali pv. lachrymans]RMM39112.1 hypothetical protein ALQ79_200192 [Pseudomonas amygdali pv. lachrymans]WIO61249.1 UvrD-helicase domain-containing protein [Pseudomonas amygdali pv. lachrymans]
MNQPIEPPYNLHELPFHIRLAAQVLGAGLDLLRARHHESWEAGHRIGFMEGSAVAQKLATPEQVRILSLKTTDPENQVCGKDDFLFGGERIQFSSDARAAMRADCESRLGRSEQPTVEQWKAILSTSNTTLLGGGAGTGKTRTLLFRALFFHRYARVPLSQIRILTFSREARVELANDLQVLFGLFDVVLTPADCHAIVMTPRSCLISQSNSLPDLSNAIPLENYGASPQDASTLSDGRPFETSLNDTQRVEMTKCLNLLYRSNKRFNETYIGLWISALRLPQLEVDSPEVVRRASFGWKLSEHDDGLSDTVEALWRKAKAWPVDGVTAARKVFTVRGRPYATHGYIPQLKLHVVLGFDRSEGPSLRRDPSASMELYKEVAIKRTLFQAYFPEGVVHLDSYQDAAELSERLKHLAQAAPSFSYALKGEETPAPVLDSFNATSALLDSLGIEVGSVPGRMNFLPADSDALYFEALAIYWEALERHLLNLSRPVIPFGRLFASLGGGKIPAVRYVPLKILEQCRHLLIDGAEDQTLPVAAWVRAVLSEIRRRDSIQASTIGLSSSLTVAGDPNQWVYGSFGATPKLITDFEDLFSSPVPATKVTLTESFRSPQTIIDAGYNLVQNLSLGVNRSPKSIFTPKGEHQIVRIVGDDPEQLQSICQSAAADGYKILILIDNDVDKAWVDSAVGGRIRDDRASGVRSIRVRSFHKAKSLEADIVVMIGDPSAGVSSWYRNQLFKLAGFSSGGDSAPGDTVYHGEALRLAHVGITRARLACIWFPNRGVDTVRTASVLGGLKPGLFDDVRRA